MIQLDRLSGSRVSPELFDEGPSKVDSSLQATPLAAQDQIELAFRPEAALRFEGLPRLERPAGDPKAALAASPGFAELAPAIRDRMLADVGNAPESLPSMQRMAASASFRGLPETTQDWAVYELSKHRDAKPIPGRDPGLVILPDISASNARRTITDLATLPGFSHLDPSDQFRLMKDIGGKNPLSDRAREALATRMLELQLFDGPSSAGKLRTFLDEQSYLPGGAADLFPMRGPAVAFTVSAGVDVTANVGVDETSAPAKQYDVTLRGRTIKVTIAEPPPANSPTADMVALSLATMPAHALQYTKDVFVSGDTARGGGANGGNGKIIVFPGTADQAPLDRLMIHEAAHMFSDVMLGNWTFDQRWDDWQSAIASDGLYPSNYGHTKHTDPKEVQGNPPRFNPSEDFAEALLTYWNVKGTPQETELRELMPARFAILDRLALFATISSVAGALRTG